MKKEEEKKVVDEKITRFTTAELKGKINEKEKVEG